MAIICTALLKFLGQNQLSEEKVFVAMVTCV